MDTIIDIEVPELGKVEVDLSYTPCRAENDFGYGYDSYEDLEINSISETLGKDFIESYFMDMIEETLQELITRGEI